MMKYALFFFSFIAFPSMLWGQFTDAIEDNSFFIEEAYNQEDRVVQHIPNMLSHAAGGDWEATFTQEWPAGSQAHQLSYTIPYSSIAGQNGVGDILVNYRYQWIRNELGWAVSPRFSISIPVGNEAKGLGNGVFGYQVNLPVSKRWSNDFVMHYNLGGTLFPDMKHPINGSEETLHSYFGGGSVIYLLTPRFNIMIEALHTVSKTFAVAAGTEYQSETIISPGVRYAIDIGELQIVPGLAFPFFYSLNRQENGVFLYASFEHPF